MKGALRPERRFEARVAKIVKKKLQRDLMLHGVALGANETKYCFCFL